MFSAGSNLVEGGLMNDIKVCYQCGAIYVPSEPQDVVTHDYRHTRLVDGVPLANVPTLPYLISDPGDLYRVSVMTSDSPLEWKQYVEEVGFWAGQSIGRNSGFTWHPYRVAGDIPSQQSVIFLLHHELRTIGLLVTTVRPWFRQLRWTQSVSSRKVTTAPTRTVEMIWVASAQRRRRLSSDIFRSMLGYLNLTPDQVAWSAPFSSDGERFVRQHYPEVVKVYGL